ncbi:hypothetical protein [uncultured Rhodospira sp.]|uniref:hypothetical protein n=1 Tax=uncultured Rhodospira sp. TaxID=1936189 RepID=UPI002638285C|nr:hypothetical protein [uncultured Rhodospira sp.]
MATVFYALFCGLCGLGVLGAVLVGPMDVAGLRELGLPDATRTGLAVVVLAVCVILGAFFAAQARIIQLLEKSRDRERSNAANDHV